jgi:nitrate/nitrite transport system permease protein
MEARTPFPAALGAVPRRKAWERLGGLGQTAAAGLGTLVVALGVWWAISIAAGKGFPTPLTTVKVLWELVRNPFYDAGPNDKGIGLQLASSLARVFAGFLAGSAVAIPLGAVMGASKLWNRVMYPIVQVLRPVSPLAWFPLGLATLKNAQNATVFAIFITSLWPTLINTAFGVGSVPKEYVQVAQVFRFSRARYFTKVLLPYSLPHIITGLRLSMGVAWMVIVAGEMLSGGTGIGFFVWDSWNSLNLDRVVSAILLIGVVGLVLDRGFEFLLKKVTHAA